MQKFLRSRWRLLTFLLLFWPLGLLSSSRGQTKRSGTPEAKPAAAANSKPAVTPPKPQPRVAPVKVRDVKDPATLPNEAVAPLPAQVSPPVPPAEDPLLPDLRLLLPDGTLVSPYGPARRLPSLPEMPPLERTYRVGKFVIKYGTDAIKRNPKKLPSEARLAAAVVSLQRTKEGLFHIPKPNDQRTLQKERDPALKQEAPPAGGPQSGGKLKSATPTKAADKPGAAAPEKPAPKNDAKPKAEDKKAGEQGAGKLEKKPETKPVPAAPEPGAIVKMKLSDFGQPQTVSAMALQDAYEAIVDQLTARGIIGVYLVAQINPVTGEDLRKGSADVEVLVFVSEVAKVRTIYRGIPKIGFRTTDLPKINDDDAPDGQPVKDPKHLWIKSKSPVFVFDKKMGGGLLDKPLLQDYLSRLNRFPGRRVDAAINATGETGKVMLDYLIREQSPWMVYFQESNTGTESTGEWRSRLGLEYRQLANMDDILRMEYVTSDFSGFNSALLSYDFALSKPDVLKMRVYGLYGDYSAQDVGLSLAQFEGQTVTAGTAVTWTPRYWHGFPLDFTLGAEFLRVSSTNDFGDTAAANFILPYLGFGTERITERYSFATDVLFKASVGGPGTEALNGLGRFDTDGDFFLVDGGLTGSVFLEPLILGSKWGAVEDGKKWWRGMLANEFYLSIRGQYTFGDRRLVPQLEYIIGGAYTVRGYPESFTSGDSGYAATAEYRLHIPRLFKPGEPSQKEKVAKNKEKQKGKPGLPEQPDPVRTNLTERGTPFRFRPGTSGAGADWDLIFRGFLDFGQTVNNNIQPSVEVNRTLMGTGVGLELQLFKPLYITLRADLGWALRSQTELVSDPVNAGDTRFNFSGTIAW